MLLDKYKLVIFDWDGTLSTSSFIVKIARFAKTRYNREDIERKKDIYKVEEVTDTKAAEEINRIYAFLYSIYAVFYTPRLKRNAMALIKHLKKNGKKVAIFSDSNRHRLLMETKKLGVVDYIDFVLSADTIDKFKPNPTGLVTIAGKLKIGKKDCVYVGDMAVDVYTARFAGIDSCAIADGVDPYWLLKSVKPKYIARSIEDLWKK